MTHLKIGAYQAFLNLTHHEIDYLEVNILEIRAEIRDIVGKNIKITGEHGYIYYRAYSESNAT